MEKNHDIPVGDQHDHAHHSDLYDAYDHSDPVERYAAGKRSTLVSVAVNLVLSSLQIGIGLVSKSQGLIADGVHSLSDLVADFVVLVANKQSKKAPDDDHQYGHLRYENAASLVLGVLLLVVGIGMLWSAIVKIQHPEMIQQVHIIALWVALAALAAKEGLFRYLLAVAKRIRSGMLIANAWHARSDAASSLVVSIGIIGNLMGFTLLDPIAAVVVGCMVGHMGWSFAWNAMNDLMDRAASEEEITGIRATLLESPDVLGLHELCTRKVGDLILVDVHLELDATLTVLQGHDIAMSARDRVMRSHPVLNVMTHVDPVDVPPASINQ